MHSEKKLSEKYLSDPSHTHTHSPAKEASWVGVEGHSSAVGSLPISQSHRAWSSAWNHMSGWISWSGVWPEHKG